jgi:hypothetical protein
MKTLNYDCLYTILDYLSNKECLNLATLSKEFLSIFSSGFATELKLNHNYPFQTYKTGYDLMNMMSKHTKRLKFLTLFLVSDPHLWMPFWTKKVYFINCVFSCEINPPEKQYVTEYICIKNNTVNNSNRININWSKFPSLKKVDIC